jgi:hypothetical protein
MPLVISSATFTTAGILLLTIVAVEYGGYHVLALTRGRAPSTPFQIAFARAGHGHAGVLVLFSLVAQLYVDGAGLTGLLGIVARLGVPLAAILMPAGFFLSASGSGTTKPNQFVWLLYVGTVSLAAGVVCLGIGLLTVPR